MAKIELMISLETAWAIWNRVLINATLNWNF
jgi:hypothetical protein